MSDINGAGNGGNGSEEAEARETRRVRRLLKQMGDIAHDASLTGAFGEGAGEAVERYNLIVAHLTERGVITGPFFPPLPADAAFDRVGVACKLLAGYLADEEAEQGGRGGGHIGGPVNEGGLFIGGDLHLHDLDELKGLGKLLRENLPALLGGQKAAESGSTSAPASEAGGAAGAPAPDADSSLLFPSGALAGAPAEPRRS